MHSPRFKLEAGMESGDQQEEEKQNAVYHCTVEDGVYCRGWGNIPKRDRRHALGGLDLRMGSSLRGDFTATVVCRGMMIRTPLIQS